MTELITDQERRQEILKGIIRDLHAGKDFRELKARFAGLIRDVGPSEIAEMEKRLIAEGMPEEEIKRLCDVHVAVFRESLDKQRKPEATPGHPIHTFRLENEALGKAADEFRALLEKADEVAGESGADAGTGAVADAQARRGEYLLEMKRALAKLAEVEKHYLRKENQLFPALEEHGVVGPPRVMWMIHDEVRAMLKTIKRALEAGDLGTVRRDGKDLVATVSDMIYKENNILFPMSLETLTEEDWARVKAGEDEVGYALISPGEEWKPSKEAAQAGMAEVGVGVKPRVEVKNAEDLEKQTNATGEAVLTEAVLSLDTGKLTPEQVNLILTHLPVDVTYVDENDRVRYYTRGKHRIFPRSPGIIGREVQNCHPPKSIDVVNRILDEFRAGTKDVAEFWINSNDRFIHIRYFALRDKGGHYRGVIEVTQDVTEIRKLEGQKRLLDW